MRVKVKSDPGPDKFGVDGVRPATATMGRRHRPKTKRDFIEIEDENDEEVEASKKASERPGKVAPREDKRTDPDEMVTSARAKNLSAERDNKSRKGKSTHALESSSPTKRPSRKSTRRSANHIKRDSQQRRQHTRAIRAPKSRHAQAG